MAGTDTVPGKDSEVEPSRAEWALRGTECPACGSRAMSVAVDMGEGSDALHIDCCECDYGAATARLDEIFDPYIRNTWPIAIWWRRAISKVVTGLIAPGATLEMPPFPLEALDDDVDDGDDDEDEEASGDGDGCLPRGGCSACASGERRDPVPAPNYADVIAKRAIRLDQAVARYKAR